MNVRLLTLSIISGAILVLRAEDGPVILNQRFRLHYNQWQAGEAHPTTSTQALYELNAGFPVFTYRLGALALNGALEYNRLSSGERSDDHGGLSRYGARLSLFPYRPFRVYLDYQRSRTPDLFNAGRIEGRTWGAGASFHSRTVQDLRLSYRDGRSEWSSFSDDWSLWRLEANQNFGSTRVNLTATRQEYASEQSTLAWRMFIATLDTESFIGRNWVLRTRSQAEDTGRLRTYDAGASVYGPIAGNLHSLTNVNTGATLTGESRMGQFFGSESLVYSTDRWHTHLSGAFAQATAPELGSGSRVASGSFGATYGLNPAWNLHGNLGVSRLRRTFEWQEAAHTLATTNVGVSRGGDVPERVRHSLFIFSDLAFERRIREEYPPDFVPSELAQEMMRRRMRQTGSFGFTADLWRTTDSERQARQDWARVTGQVQTRGAFTLYLSGDYRHDLDLAQIGLDTRSADLVANASHRVGETSLTAALGYSNYRQSLSSIGRELGITPTATGMEGQARYFSLGVSSVLARRPVGVMVFRYAPAAAVPTTSLATWADLGFRQVSIRLRYEVSRTDAGFKSSRVSLDLIRWFDSVVLGFRR